MSWAEIKTALNSKSPADEDFLPLNEMIEAFQGSMLSMLNVFCAKTSTVIAKKGTETYTTTSDNLGIATFRLDIGIWEVEVVGEKKYTMHILRQGEMYSLQADNRPKLDELSWAEIKTIGSMGLADKYFSIGDAKNFTISPATSATCEIVGMYHDDLVGGGKAPLTFMFKNFYENRTMNATQINTTSWKDSLMRTSHLPTIKAKLPVDLVAVVQPVIKRTATSGANAVIIETQDDFWLPSSVEMFGAEATTSYAGEGVKYPRFTDNASRIKKLGNTGTASHYWTRSPYNVSADTTNFVRVNSNGTVSITSATSSNGVVLGFCV